MSGFYGEKGFSAAQKAAMGRPQLYKGVGYSEPHGKWMYYASVDYGPAQLDLFVGYADSESKAREMLAESMKTV